MLSDQRASASEDQSADPRWQLVKRVLASQQLKSSARLCEFLSYVADCALRDAPEEATEQQIGIRVFGRPPGYNSSEDSIVRTQARLLRHKLAAYFDQEGKQEPLVIEMPKGHYLPQFRERVKHSLVVPSLELPVEVSVPVETLHTVSPIPAKSRSRIWTAAVLLLLLLLLAIGWTLYRKAQPAQTPFESFWRPFLNDDPPLVIYSNALFTGDSTHGLRYASPSDPVTDQSVDTYTGVGELASVYALSRLFDSKHATFILKRSRLVTWDEAKTHNLIFVGAPIENISLRVLQPATDFTFVAHADSAAVVNHRPQPGELKEYSRPEHPLTHDYATIALLPGVQPGKRTLVLSGLMTFGTEAAVEYICRPDYVADLVKRARGPHGEIRPFEAVIETSVGGGVPLQAHLVALHVH